MELKIRMNIPDDTSFIVTFNNKTHISDRKKPVTIFEFAEKGTYTLEIEQEVIQNKINILSILFYSIISFVQTMFYILLSADFNDWYIEIKPYIIKMTAKIYLEDSGEIEVSYLPGKFIDIGNGMWQMTEFKYKSVLKSESEIEVSVNERDFNIKLFHYLRKISAFFIILDVFFLVIGISVYQKQNTGAVIFIFVLAAASAAAQIFGTIRSVKRKNLLLKRAYEKLRKA